MRTTILKYLPRGGGSNGSRYMWVVAALLLVTVLALFLGYISYQTSWDHRIRGTMASLQSLRKAIEEYRTLENRYPSSLREFQKWNQDHGNDVWDRMFVTLSAPKKGDVCEHRELNGKGGYCYDPGTGMVRLNLTRPVREYLPWYVGRFADRVPADW